MDWKDNNNFKNNIKIINNDKNILDISVFIKLIKPAKYFKNFESYKILFLHIFYLLSEQKKNNKYSIDMNKFF